MGLGGGPGLAGAASLAAVAISQLTKHVGDLRDILQGAWLGVPAEELAKIRQNAEEAAEAFDKLMQLRPRGEEERQKGIIGAMQEADPEQVMKATREAIMRDEGLRPKLGPGDAADILKRAMGKAMFDTEAKGFKALQEEAKADILNERADAETKRILGNLGKHGPEGDRARQDMARLQKANPNTPLPNIEGIEQQQVMDKWLKMEKLQSEIGMQKVKEDEKEKKAAEKKAKDEKKVLKDFDREMKAAEKRATMEVLQDQAEEERKRIEKLKHGMTPAAVQAAEDIRLGGRRQENSQILSTKAYVDRTLTGSLSRGDQRKIDELVKANRTLDEIRKSIKDVGRLK